MAAQGVPMRALQELMRHRDFATTLIYADYAPSAHEAEWAEAAFASPDSDLTTAAVLKNVRWYQRGVGWVSGTGLGRPRKAR
jgi:hypothetical protein